MNKNKLDFDDDDDVIDPIKESKLEVWKNPPKIDDLKADLTTAQSDHDIHINKVNGWLDNLNITGKAKQNNGKNKSNVVPKLIRKQAEWRYSELSEPFLSTDNMFKTDPITFEDKKAAIQNGLVLNDQFNSKINKIHFIDEYVRAAVDEGTVVVRTGWDYEEEIQKVTVQDFEYILSQDPTYLQQLQQLIQGQQDDPINFKQIISPELQQAVQMSMQLGQPIYPNPIGSHVEQQVKVIKNCPTVDVCNYNDVIIDPSCWGNLDKANFIIYMFETSLSELEKDNKYSNLDQIELDTTSQLSQENYHREQYSFKFKDKPRQKLIAYEYWGFWDIDDTGIIKPIIVTWVGNTIIRQETNPFPDKKLPFIKVQYLPVRKANYGEPDGELLEDNQKIIGAITRGMIDTMGRSANGQMGTSKDALDTINRRKFDKGEDYEFNPGKDPRQAFYMHSYPEISKSAEYMLNMQNMEAESITGVKSYSQGVNSNSLGDVAAGIKGALSASAMRKLGILRRLSDGIVQIGRKFVSMNSEFLSEEEVIRITNEEFVIVRRDDLAGNIDIRLTVSTSEADEQKASELSFMLQTMGNTMPPDFSQMILADIARLRKMPDLAKKIEKYQPSSPPPDPMQEIQMQLLQAQIATEQAKAMEYQTSAMLNQNKSNTEVAKAEQIKALADKTNLDFVEQESGTAHKRAVETVQAQAKGNIALEQVKHGQSLQSTLVNHDLDNQAKIVDHQMNTQHKMMDHNSKIDQIEIKPKITKGN